MAAIQSIDDLMDNLSARMDLKTGKDLFLQDQIEVHKKKQAMLQQKAIAMQVVTQICLDLKPKLNRSVFSDFLTIVGKSYTEGTGLDEEEDEDDTREAIQLKQSFDEHIKPMIEEKILQMTTNLRITLAIAEGKSIDQINQFQSNVENIKDFLKDSKPISQLVDDMNSQINKAKEINEKSKEMKQEMRNEVETISG
jgi:hypothetical protein